MVFDVNRRVFSVRTPHEAAEELAGGEQIALEAPHQLPNTLDYLLIEIFSLIYLRRLFFGAH